MVSEELFNNFARNTSWARNVAMPIVRSVVRKSVLSATNVSAVALAVRVPSQKRAAAENN